AHRARGHAAGLGEESIHARAVARAAERLAAQLGAEARRAPERIARIGIAQAGSIALAVELEVAGVARVGADRRRPDAAEGVGVAGDLLRHPHELVEARG